MTAKLMHYVNDEVQSSDDATWRQELPNKGALHAVLLKVQCTNGATSGRGVNILDCVDEIEVVGNGSEVLYSLYPTEFEKWYETLHGRPLQTVEDETADAVQEMVFPLFFGRSLYDPAYYLPLARFSDVKLEITYSPSIAADGGFATGTTSFDIELLITPEDALLSYEGTLITRRINSYTTAASGDQEIQLPDQAIVRAIGNYVYEAGVGDGTDVSKVVLEDKADGSKLFEADWDDFVHLNRELFGVELTHRAKLYITNNDTWNSRIGEILNITHALEETPNSTNDEFDVLHVDGFSGDQLTIDLKNVDITAGAETITASTTDRVARVSVTGKSPSYFGLIPFVYDDTPAGWLNTSKYGNLKVVHTNGGAGGTAYVSLQSYRQY